MLSAIADTFRSILSKPNLIYHFRLNFPLSQMKVDSITEELRRIRSSKSPKIALSLNASQGPSKHYLVLFQQFSRINQQHKIPIYCFLEDQVTTEGYMLACCADVITANPFSIVGDIGAYSSYINIGNLLKKYNIKYENLGPSKGLFNRYQEPQKEAAGQRMVDYTEKLIVDTVSRRRGIPVEEVQKLTGKLFTAKQALESKLIDGIGTYPQWKAKQKRQSEEYSIGFTSFELNITVIQEALFSHLFKLSSGEKSRLREFVEENNVVQRVLQMVSNNPTDQRLVSFIDSRIVPILQRALQS